MDLNSVTLFGRLARDPELRQVPNSDLVATTFTLANSSWKKSGSEWQEDTNWFECSMFGDGARRFCERAKKGHRVLVIGSLKQRKWKDKDGNPQERIGISVRAVQYLEKKPKIESDTTTETASEEAVPF